MKMRKIIGLTAVLLFAHSAEACKCIKSSFEEKIDEAVAVFTVQVTSLHLTESEESFSGVEVGYKLLAPLKGAQEQAEPITTGFGMGDCGFEFKIRQYYLILVDAENTVNICNGSLMLVPPSLLEDFPQTTEFLSNVEKYINTELAKIPVYDDPISHRNSDGFWWSKKSNEQSPCDKK